MITPTTLSTISARRDGVLRGCRDDFAGGYASIRHAQVEDAEAIAAVHVAAWQESYADLMPAEMLASLSVEVRADRWRRILGKPDPAIATAAFIACVPGGSAVGFGSCGLQRSAELARAGFGGEFQALYVLRAAQRRGIGRALMGAMARDLAGRSIQGSALWVLGGNQPALKFYAVLGGTVAAHREDRRGEGAVLAEIAYGWASVTPLATAAP